LVKTVDGYSHLMSVWMDECLKRVNYEASSDDNLFTCKFLIVLAKEMIFESKIDYYTAVNEHLNVQ
jgi:hypothetical protein